MLSIESVAKFKKLLNASAIILRRVGAFEEGMRALRKLNLVQPIKQKVLEQKTPILGIAGMQMLADTSFENGRRHRPWSYSWRSS